MGWFSWLASGVKKMNNFFDSLYNRLPSTVRGLIIGAMTVYIAVASFFGLPTIFDLAKLLDWLLRTLFPGGK